MDNAEALLLRERVAALYKNSLSGIAITSLAGTLLTFGFESSAVESHKVLWWLVMVTLMVLRLAEFYRWRQEEKQEDPRVVYNLWRFRLAVVFTALLWAFYCQVFYASFSVYELTSTVVVVSAMAGGAATVLSGDRLSSLVYTQILLLPYSLLLLLGEDSPYQVLGVLGIGFAVVMYINATRAADFMLASIKLRFEHTQLLENMEQEVRSRTQEVVELSRRDTLTGLLNRRSFLEMAAQRLRDAPNDRHAIVFIDLNGFKPVNDNLGHKVGDELLRSIAGRLKTLEVDDKLICRWGGDEFILFSHIESDAELAPLMHRIEQIFATAWQVQGYPLEITAALGTSIYPEHGTEIDGLVTFADIAMYRHKGHHELDYVVFDSELAASISHEFYLSEALREAVSREQFSLVFQPILNSVNGEYDGFEALLRWRLNDDFVPPDQFIPLAEKNGAIRIIGYWVLEEAVRQAKPLVPMGLNVCVNVSLLQFDDTTFVDNVQRIMTEHDFPPERLHIELTESIFAGEQSSVTQSLEALQHLGIRISVDDFGTGYSSLSVIQNLQVNVVKIDKSFVEQLEGNGLNVVRAVMVMAEGLGYDVVAEGVETEAQAELLRSLGVQYLQGYLYGRPISMTDILNQLEQKRQLVERDQ